MNIGFSFIVIDDSELDCFLVQKIIAHTDKSLITKTFQDAAHALEMIRENPAAPGKPSTIVFLDLQMPLMSGFKFVEEFEKLPPAVRNNYIIIILTILSSLKDPVDTNRILTYGAVRKIIEKPFTKEKLFSLLTQLGATA